METFNIAWWCNVVPNLGLQEYQNLGDVHQKVTNTTAIAKLHLPKPQHMENIGNVDAQYFKGRLREVKQNNKEMYKKLADRSMEGKTPRK